MTGLCSPMQANELAKSLCNAFCAAVDVRSVATGFAVSSVFLDSAGDPISFYLTETVDGFVAEDDGSYLSNLVARDIPIHQGYRGQILDGILAESSASWDRESFEIRSEPFASSEVAQRSIDLLSALIRVRDLELLTRDAVRSTFREDAISALEKAYANYAFIEENAPLDKDFAEFPADVVVRSKSSAPDSTVGGIYFVNNDAKLNEALLLKMELQQSSANDNFRVIALIEEPTLKQISRRKFQRAQNRSLVMPIFRGDEEAAMRMIGRELRIIAQ